MPTHTNRSSLYACDMITRTVTDSAAIAHVTSSSPPPAFPSSTVAASAKIDSRTPFDISTAHATSVTCVHRKRFLTDRGVGGNDAVSYRTESGPRRSYHIYSSRLVCRTKADSSLESNNIQGVGCPSDIYRSAVTYSYLLPFVNIRLLSAKHVKTRLLRTTTNCCSGQETTIEQPGGTTC